MMNQGGNNQSARARLRLVAGLSVMATLVLVSSFGCTGGGRAGSADLISEDEVVADVDGGGLDIPGDADLVPEELVGELPAPEAVSGEFTLLTYNVAGLPEGISSSHPEEYIPLISPMLNAFELVLVQEDFVYHEQLAAEVDHPHHTPSLYDSLDDFPLGDGLNRFSLFPMGRVHRLQWPGCSGELDCSSDCLASKGFSLARTELAGGLSVDVYNLHGEAGGFHLGAVRLHCLRRAYDGSDGGLRIGLPKGNQRLVNLVFHDLRGHEYPKLEIPVQSQENDEGRTTEDRGSVRPDRARTHHQQVGVHGLRHVIHYYSIPTLAEQT